MLGQIEHPKLFSEIVRVGRGSLRKIPVDIVGPVFLNERLPERRDRHRPLLHRFLPRSSARTRWGQPRCRPRFALLLISHRFRAWAERSDKLELFILFDFDLAPVGLAFAFLLASVLAVRAGSIRGCYLRKLLLARVLGPADKQKGFMSGSVTYPFLRQLGDCPGEC